MPAPSFSTLRAKKDGEIAIVTLDRPDDLNALNRQMIGELSAAMTMLAADEAIRGVIVTGAGEAAFMAGSDLQELGSLSPDDAEAHARAGQALMDKIENLGKPVIAALNGYAIGAGCELAAACTMRIAADHARLAQPDVRIGLIPHFGGTQRLPRLIGKGRALQMILSGDMMDAQEALRIGLVDEIVAKEKLIDRAEAILWTIATNAPLAIRAALDAVHAGVEGATAQGLDREASLFSRLAATEDAKEGIAAFIAQRKPRFKGR